MATKKREIYARLGVQLRNNRRVLKAERTCPGAFGLYCFCVLDTRAELLDGFVSEDAVLTALGVHPKLRGKQAEALCSVDLLERVEGGYRVVKYEEHNDTVADIAASRERVKGRVTEHRKRSTVTRYTPVTNADVPISISISPSGNGSTSEESKAGTGPPTWWDAACDTAELGGDRVTDRPARWVQYDGSMHRKGWQPTQKHAAGWLVAVLRRERDDAAKSGATTTKQSYDPEAPWLKAAGGDD